jgi:L-arabinokinase
MIADTRRLVFGITAHGLGHLTRACQLANALFESDADLEFHFWTDIPEERIATELAMPFSYRRVAYEPGTAQRNCFELDLDQTVRDYQAFGVSAQSRLEQEIEALHQVGWEQTAVVSDAPALLVRAAAELGMPAVAVSNFTWDWILEPILEGTAAEPVLDWLRESYAMGQHHIRLPFGPSTSPFPSSERGPLISRRSTRKVADLMRVLGIEPDRKRPIALVCPGGWDPEGWDAIRPDTRRFQLILVGDLPVETRAGDVSLPHRLDPSFRFPDLVNLADVVLAKPGYGIASECVAHRTPLVTIDRPAFRETDLLRSELDELGPCGELSVDDFFAGHWASALTHALDSSKAWMPLEFERADLELARRLRAVLEAS